MWRGRQQRCRFVHSVASLITFVPRCRFVHSVLSLITFVPHVISRASTPLTFLLSHISWDVTTWPTCRVLFKRYQFVVCRKTYCLCRRLHWNRYDRNVISPDCLAPKDHTRQRDMTICVCAASRDVRIVCPQPYIPADGLL